MLVNLTPHDIIIRTGDGDVTIPPTGTPARVEPGAVTATETIAGVPVITWGEGEVVNLPPAVPGTFLIVSAVVGARVRHRADVLCPGTGPNDGAIRVPEGPRKGQIEAVTCLVRP
jgi:hypothetical protein